MADTPYRRHETQQNDGGMPYILGEKADRNGDNCRREDQSVKDCKEIHAYSTQHAQQIACRNEEKRAPSRLQRTLASGLAGWEAPPKDGKGGEYRQ